MITRRQLLKEGAVLTVAVIVGVPVLIGGVEANTSTGMSSLTRLIQASYDFNTPLSLWGPQGTGKVTKTVNALNELNLIHKVINTPLLDMLDLEIPTLSGKIASNLFNDVDVVVFNGLDKASVFVQNFIGGK